MTTQEQNTSSYTNREKIFFIICFSYLFFTIIFNIVVHVNKIQEFYQPATTMLLICGIIPLLTSILVKK